MRAATLDHDLRHTTVSCNPPPSIIVCLPMYLRMCVSKFVFVRVLVCGCGALCLPMSLVVYVSACLCLSLSVCVPVCLCVLNCPDISPNSNSVSYVPVLSSFPAAVPSTFACVLR